MLFQIRADDGVGHKAEIIKHYLIPTSLCSAETPVCDISEFIEPILRAHETDVLSSAPFLCVECGNRANGLCHSLTVRLLMKEPSIVDCSLPICQPGFCQSRAEKQHKALVKQLKQLHPEQKILFTASYHACTLCRQTKNTKRCSRCKHAYYCSITCQREDWNRHRPYCVLCTDNAGATPRAD